MSERISGFINPVGWGESNKNGFIEFFKSRLSYDENTGVFMWLNNENVYIGVRGRVAGGVKGHGYIEVKILGKNYKCHRLAWLFVHGVFPNGEIDHIDSDKTNNRISNLRDISHALNVQNLTKPRKDNKSGYLGVSWNKKSSKWEAQISKNKIVHRLGCFDDPSQAHEVYLAAKRKMHEACTI